MTSEDVRSELEKFPFVPFRVHMVSGKTLDVRTSAETYMLQDAILIFQEVQPEGDRAGRYNVVALRNIERIEQVP